MAGGDRYFPGCVICLLLTLFPVSQAGSQARFFDLAGRPVNAESSAPWQMDPSTGHEGILFLADGSTAAGGSVPAAHPAGYYLTAGPEKAPIPPFSPPFSQPLFTDGTPEYLPLREWDIGDIEMGDLDGDGLDDIVFPLARSDCDSIPGDRPRVWMQTQTRRFFDETESRIPDFSTSTYDLDIFDADGDTDQDILVCGYDCGSHGRVVSLLINDGNGHFTEESAGRIPALPGNSFIYFAEPGLIDSDSSMDIVAIIIDLASVINPVIRPLLLLNDGEGNFRIDSLGRIGPLVGYGFFDLALEDFTGDGRNDILFLNISAPSDNKSGQLALLRNSGDGFMVDETVTRLPQDHLRRTRDVALADVDRDGDVDILDVGFFYGANTPQVRLLKNNPVGYFTDDSPEAISSLSGAFNDAEFAPLSNDSLPDLYITKVYIGIPALDVLMLNAGGGIFRDSSELLPHVVDFSVAAAVTRYQDDGDFDLVIGNGYQVTNIGGQNRLYINRLVSPTLGVDDPPGIPARTVLDLNYPNPFNASTVIGYDLAGPSGVVVTITNLLGQPVLRADRGHQRPGRHRFLWEARDLPAGVYFYTIEIDGDAPPARPALLLK